VRGNSMEIEFRPQYMRSDDGKKKLILLNVDIGLVHILKDQSFDDGSWQPATINWSCVGAVPPAKAKEFAECVAAAVVVAAYLDDDPEQAEKGRIERLVAGVIRDLFDIRDDM